MKFCIITGASGCGKTYMVNKFRSKLIGRTELIQKLTNRNNPGESFAKDDLRYDASIEEILKCEYHYMYAGHYYGIRKSEIDYAISLDQNILIIVRDYSTAQKLKADYSFASIIYVRTRLTGMALKTALKKVGVKDDVLPKDRVERERREYLDKVKSNIDIDSYIENDFNNSSINASVQKALRNASDVNYFRIFLAMPFNNSANGLYNRNLFDTFVGCVKHILNGGANDGTAIVEAKYIIASAEREDATYNAAYSITNRIEQQLINSYIVICDVSSDNANVAIEMEMALLRNKHVITIGRRGSCENKHVDFEYSDGGITQIMNDANQFIQEFILPCYR